MRRNLLLTGVAMLLFGSLLSLSFEANARGEEQKCYTLHEGSYEDILGVNTCVVGAGTGCSVAIPITCP